MSSIPKLILFLPLCSLFLTLSCEKNTTPFEKQTSQIDLTVEEVTCTEAWLRLKVEEPPEGTTFQLLRGDSAVASGTLTSSDTLLYDEDLLPNRNYAYRSFLLKDEKRIASSGEPKVTTMDTTSHEFQWEIIEIPSPFGSGAL
jgi:hypothetical protein